MKKLTEAQKKAHARNALFRQLHGLGLKRFILDAVNEEAITVKKYKALNEISMKIEYLKRHQKEINYGRS